MNSVPVRSARPALVEQHQPEAKNLSLDRMDERHFRALVQILETETGIRLPPSKKTMVEGRLRRRLRVHEFVTLDEYCAFLLHRNGLNSELVHLIDCVTTNTTNFFREPDHFVTLCERIVPRLLAERQGKSERHLKIWSAAASIGAEAYTLAMVLADIAANRNFKFSILGTDISTAVLQQAVHAVYPASMMEPVPPLLRQRFVMQSADPKQETVRIVPELRALCRFKRLNLMEAHYPIDTDVDVIFVRNILIYFARSTQDDILERLCAHLRPGGFLFLGHAESMAGAERFSMQSFAPTIYLRQ